MASQHGLAWLPGVLAWLPGVLAWLTPLLDLA